MDTELWLYPLIGGSLIGLAASLLLLTQGRIFGVTGILSGALFTKDKAWRISILFGLMTGSLFIYLLRADFFQYQFNIPIFWMAIAGLLVGYGTRLGSGCTSGHGICGLPRLSLRSLVAVLSFMLSGAVTVYLFKHVFQIY